MARLKFESVEPRKCLNRKIIDPDNGEVLDNGLVVWFPGPKSYTGEDSAELHIHGGLAVIASVIKALQKFPGCRIAEPGKQSCFRLYQIHSIVYIQVNSQKEPF